MSKSVVYSRVFALAGVFVSVLALLGWFLEIRLLNNLTSIASLNPMTGMCILFLGFGLLFSTKRSLSDKQSARVSLIFPFLTLIICVLKAPSFVGWTFQVDQVFKLGFSGNSHMSIATTLCLFLLSVALLYHLKNKKWQTWPSQILALIALLICFFAIVGYLYNTSSLLNSPVYEGLSLNTAIALTFIAISLLLLRVQSGWVQILSSPYSGSLVARRLLPLVIASPVAVNMIWIFGSKIGLYDLSFAISSSAFTKILILSGMLLWLCSALNVVDEARTESEKKQKELNLDLARAVDQLKELNEELKSFSYSIAHDLRTPLRSISYYMNSVLSDSQLTLEKKTKEELDEVFEASQRMGLLINGLMSLYKVNRANIKQKEVNLSDLVDHWLDIKIKSEPLRRVELRVEANLKAIGDPALLENLIVNLFDNAWKFSSKKEVTIIEFGMKVKDGQVIYFVKDNGAGFNMEYKKQLFKTFKRLHTEQEFPGTGIGLVTAQRIVNRHQGKIWVESELNQGTCFYFTLDKSWEKGPLDLMI